MLLYFTQGTAISVSISALYECDIMDLLSMISFTRELRLYILISYSAFTTRASFTNQLSVLIPNLTSTFINNETHLVVYFDNKEVVLKKMDIPTEPPALHFLNNIDSLLKE